MKHITLIVFAVIWQFIHCQFRRRTRLGFYRRQDVTSSKSNLPSVWYEIQSQFAPDVFLYKIGSYTKLVVGMEYQIFFVIYKHDTNDIELFRSQAYIKENDLRNKINLSIEALNTVTSQGQMSIHHSQYIMINRAIGEWAESSGEAFLCILFIEAYNCKVDSEKIVYYDVRVRLKNSSLIKRFIVEDENGVFRLVIELKSYQYN